LLEPPELDEPELPDPELPEPPALVPPVSAVPVVGAVVDGVLVALAGAAVVVSLLLLPQPLQARPNAATARTAAKLIERFICTSFFGGLAASLIAAPYRRCR
jgi:hypothetical protein